MHFKEILMRGQSAAGQSPIPVEARESIATDPTNGPSATTEASTDERRDKAELLAYIADMLDGLQALTRTTGDETLSALLKLAQAHAAIELQRSDPRLRR
jgi:hypothetical protein